MKAGTRRPKAATPAETIDAAAATNQLLTEVLPLSTGARACWISVHRRTAGVR
jgi:hypothetical protein